jgi:hypothetical protein
MDIKTSLLFALDFYLGRFDHGGRLFEHRMQHCLSIQEASPYREPREPEPLPSVHASEVNAKIFAEMTDRYRRPLVIRGLLADARSTRHWTPDYFIEHCGDSAYPVMSDCREEDPRTKQSQMEVVTIRDLAGSIKAGNPDYRYMNNLTRIFVDHPVLARDLELDRLLVLFENAGSDEVFDVLNMFMGGRGTGCNLHCAFAGNFFNMIAGRKEWLLLSPELTPYLLPLPGKPFIYSDAYFDPGDEELGRFTRNLPSYRVVLEPGDVLYNAPWWWHRVSNPDGFTVGCAVRCTQIRADLSNNAMFSFMSEEWKLGIFKALFYLQKSLTGSNERFRDRLHREIDKEIYVSMTDRPS